ncbi:hypothetical protein GH714_000732 [Hevea brasiliensis]|uniref:Disease resistance N-terminal domain-containing protein n=1 Tax=Hevea brasiliensis TaxID=3981 RepID=A0A6A6KZ04_HEVBR|nr:hypothetical protein GH714_000732 [Hevea brasiliensis]
MAEAVLFNIANEIFKKLESQALVEIRWWWNLEDDLEKLKNTVSTIQAVLLDVEKQYSENQQVKFGSKDSMIGQRPDNRRVDALKNKLQGRLIEKSISLYWMKCGMRMHKTGLA